jgi:uncharacterized repeat protein (TIGR01451 family)
LSATTVAAATYTLTSTASTIDWSDVSAWNGGAGTTYPGRSAGDVVTVNLNGNTLRIDVALNPIQLSLSGSGTLSTSSPLSLTGSNTWGGSTITGSGGVTLVSGAILDLNGSGAVLDGATLTNLGTMKITSSSANVLKLANAAKISNGGLMDIQSDGGMTADATVTWFDNNGTLQKSAGTGTSTIAGAFRSLGSVLANTGILSFASFNQYAPGTTQLNGGNLQSPLTLWFTGGKVLGGGEIDGDVHVVTATLEPGRGVARATLNVTGNVEQDGGVLIVDCFANEVTDKYVIGGTAGVSNIRLLWSGGYDPADGDRFDDVIVGSTVPKPPFFNYFPFGYNNTGGIRQTTSATSVSYYATIPTDDLAISETVGANAPPATTYPVTITVKNLGLSYPSPQVALSISNGSIVSTSSSAYSCNGSGASTLCTTVPFFSIAPDATATITVNVSVTSGNATLTGTVTGQYIDPNPGNNTAAVTIPPAAVADLALAISGSPDPVYAGQAATYTYTVKNAGPAPSTTTVTATIAEGSIVAVGTGCVKNTSTVATCTTPSIAPGESAAVIVTATASPVTETSFPSHAMTASGTVAPPEGTGDPNLSDNSASQVTAVNPLADISIVMHAPAEATPGGTITYTLDVANLGPSEADGELADPTPPGLTFVKFTDGPCYAFPCNLTPFEAGGKRTIVAVYNIAPNLTGTIENTASESSHTFDPVSSNNTAHAATKLITSACPDRIDAPVPSVVASAVSHETYDVQWPAVDSATQYEIDEATDANFTNPSTQTVTTTVVSFTHGVGDVQAFYYRVRAFSACAQQFSAYSQTVSVIIVPPARHRAVRR